MLIHLKGRIGLNAPQLLPSRYVNVTKKNTRIISKILGLYKQHEAHINNSKIIYATVKLSKQQ